MPVSRSVRQPGIGRLYVLGLPGNLVLLVENRLALGVVEPQRGVDLTPAFDGLLIEFVGAALFAVESRLEMIAHVEEQIDGAAGVGIGGQPFAIAHGFKVEYGRASGKNTPVHGIGESLLLRKAETGTRRAVAASAGREPGRPGQRHKKSLEA